MLGSQKLIDDLTVKVKLFEYLLQDWTSQLEIFREMSIFKAASLPVASEISEVEDVVYVIVKHNIL